MPQYKSDIEIAQETPMLPIVDVARRAGIREDLLEPYGRYKAKVNSRLLADTPERGKLILVTAINPTPAGEGKTTTSVGLADALNQAGHKAMLALREPSLGPVFGIKGGAAGGGYAQVVPMEDINLHFTGDFHAISAANNLCAAMLDNHIKQGNELGIDPRRVVWKRCVDRRPVTVHDIHAEGAMTALLKDALLPNLVQTLEHTPALVHGGPFANIAHGCNSVEATKTALCLADYVITEAGFGADLGAEKFLDIKCRKSGLFPNAVVLVATVRALKYNGGIPKAELGSENLAALEAGLPNLLRHVDNLKGVYGLPVVVAINAFPTDTASELELIEKACKAHGVDVALSEVWAKGGKGGQSLAEAVLRLCERSSEPKYAYDLGESLEQKMASIATKIYHAEGVDVTPAAAKQIQQLEGLGFGELPVCMAKTQYSFSDDPSRLGAPEHFRITVREVRVSAGAGFVVCLTGNIMTMPGLPKKPAAENIDVREDGRIVGLF